jgi:hypothetical protein
VEGEEEKVRNLGQIVEPDMNIDKPTPEPTPENTQQDAKLEKFRVIKQVSWPGQSFKLAVTIKYTLHEVTN